MPESGEFYHHISWVEDEIRQIIHTASLLEGDPPPGREAVRMREIHDAEGGVRRGARIFIDIGKCSTEVQDRVREIFGDITIPGITITQEIEGDRAWIIDASIQNMKDAPDNDPARSFSSRPGWTRIFSEGLVAPLMMELNDDLGRINYRLTTDLVMPGRIVALAEKIPGANPKCVTLECVADDETFARRVKCHTSDPEDPFWKRLVHEAGEVQARDFTGRDRKFHTPFEFEMDTRVRPLPSPVR